MLCHLIFMVMNKFITLPIPKREYENESPIFLPVSDWEFTKHSNYWVITKLFKEGGLDLYKEMAMCYPIIDRNADDGHIDHNPFQVHHMPHWFTNPISEAVREFVLREHFRQGPELQLIEERLSEWGNVYIKGECHPLINSHIPHVDFTHDEGFIGNLWLSEHEERETETRLYKYRGYLDEGRYDFQLDTRHHRYKEWSDWVGDGTHHVEGFQNLSSEQAYHWGFRQIDAAPCRYGTMTIYNANTPHCPFVADSVEWRWSHCFGFKYKSLSTLFKTPEVHF